MQPDRRNATVMFVDILGASDLSARAGIEHAYAIITGCLRELDGIARQHGGVVDKYLSDCLMVAFGLPVGSDDAALAAVGAATEMLAAASRYSDQVSSEVPLQLRIGINTGPMLVGSLHGRLVREFAVMGDAVNVAARLKDLGEPGCIHVGPETYHTAQRSFLFTSGETLPLRGKTERVPVFRVVATTDVRRPRHHGLLADTPLFGRARELAGLHQALSTVRSGQGRTLIVLAEPGSGKSRLVREFSRTATADGVGVLLLDADNLAGIEEALSALVRQGPTMVTCEDVQLAGDASLALITRLVSATAHRPCLWLFTARANTPTTVLAALGPHDLMHLAPLTTTDAHALVDHVTGGSALSAGAWARIDQRAGGNPYKLIRAALLAGAIESEVAHDASSIERASDSERRRVTVLFADITGFTRMSEQLPAAETYRAVTGCLAILHEVAERHGGSVDKYLGDCIMAVFGVPVAIEDAPRAAVNAAIEMRRRVRDYNEIAGLPSPLDIHVGINTGLSVAGDVSGPLLREYTLMGEAVSAASKLKDAAPAGEIWVGAATHRATDAEFHYVPVKNQAAFELRSEYEHLHRAERNDRPHGLFSTMIGRDAEAAVMARRLHALGTGHGSIITVVGEAGLGKSRLVQETLASALEMNLTLLAGRSLAMGATQRFHPFADLFQRWADIAANDHPSTAAAKLATAITPVLGDTAADAYPFLATLAGIRLTDAEAERIDTMDADALELMLAKHAREWLVALADTRPCCVLFEDLHWADQSTLKLLTSFLPLVREHALLIVLVYRSEDTPALQPIEAAIQQRLGNVHDTLRLTPLASQQALALLHNLLDDHDRPHPAWPRVLARAAGNPFFIEEIIRSLIDEGALVRTAEGLTVTERIETAIVPATVQEVVLARVDRLPARDRQILRLAAVIGRRSPARLLEAITPDRTHLDEVLARLAHADLLAEERHADESTWTFFHALSQETVYGSILHSDCQGLHLQVATAIEVLYADRLPDFHGPLAWHYTRAESLDKAEHYLFKAGEDAARAAASDEALALFKEASRLFLARDRVAGDFRKQARLEKHIGLALLNSGTLSESIRHFDEGLKHVGAPARALTAHSHVRVVPDLIAIVAQLYGGLRWRRDVIDWEIERDVWQMFFNRGRAEITSDPTRLFFDTVAGFRQLNRIDAGKMEQSGALYASCASVFCYSGLSFAIGRRALASAKRLARPDSIQDAFTCAVMDFTVDYLQGRWRRAPVVSPALLADAIRCGQLWDANTYLGLRCDQQLRQGDFGGALVHLEQLAKLRDTYNFRFAGGNHDGMRAVLLTESRSLDAALASIDQYLAGRHEEPLRAFGCGTRAKIHVLRGDLDSAAKSLASAETSLVRAIPPWHRSAIVAAQLRLIAARLAAGDRSARKDVSTAILSACWVARAVAIQRTEICQLIGCVLHELGRERAALAIWAKSVRIGMAMGARPEVARTHVLLARHLGSRRLGHLNATHCRVMARTTFNDLGLHDEVGALNDRRDAR